MFQRIQFLPRRILWLLVFTFLLTIPVSAQEIPDGFIRINQFIPDATYEVRYYTNHNFVGERVDGYTAPVVILTTQAATALKKVQADLKPFNLGLKIFDGYRPQQAVDHFVRWAKDINNTRTKTEFYPDVDKKDLFRDGYIAAQSGHSRGSTVDLTIIDLSTSTELDMGTPFDFFGPKSWPDNKSMPLTVRANRALLQTIMLSNGFNHLKEEWWHFTLMNEPYTDTYFNFPIH
ncbi:M15 family metallopeptidase [uncultured Pseudodesulfovibrio sp.]|uniref:M15 family metallopeptidase n=1 Tax=uncultured Pseudodesulfovibrio sp. TaxID=2035858 RepID=UPI0029C9436D|nr:M15 family metallopeptidase [uncultured Pseudodesulfovibrio sp.]